ncbi:uncharacterized protein KQ657_004740 [Scheffersomyces spartinae]|uniref:NDT80 domain-containing protein n=1 Tax=Scheffersomyces spartinae TaxID=45513 RepID=A0A9P7VB39_9ASCO|nr:uncharacterized protein KQ657_004740 [Scheffersomyces spartinae]KAG7194525.1 hypothetical protein KQ657_004740 [Scheffersomyces spartinae]
MMTLPNDEHTISADDAASVAVAAGMGVKEEDESIPQYSTLLNLFKAEDPLLAAASQSGAGAVAPPGQGPSGHSAQGNPITVNTANGGTAADVYQQQLQQLVLGNSVAGNPGGQNKGSGHNNGTNGTRSAQPQGQLHHIQAHQLQYQSHQPHHVHLAQAAQQSQQLAVDHHLLQQQHQLLSAALQYQSHMPLHHQQQQAQQQSAQVAQAAVVALHHQQQQAQQAQQAQQQVHQQQQQQQAQQAQQHLPHFPMHHQNNPDHLLHQQQAQQLLHHHQQMHQQLPPQHLHHQLAQHQQHQQAQAAAAAAAAAATAAHPTVMELMAHDHLDLLEPASNRKVAPRSADLFRVGPHFLETRHHQDIYCKANDMDVTPILQARIDRGFEMGENGTWIGYKRNYFTLVASFHLENFDFDRFIMNKYYTYEKHGKHTQHHHIHGLHPHHMHNGGNGGPGESKVEISYFAIRLVAKCSDDDVAISLVQRTPKRDKEPQFPPPIYPAVPAELPDHETVKASCNKRNGSKIENMNKVFYFDRGDYYGKNGLDQLKDMTILKNYPSDSIARVARFERIQFTSSIRIKATSVNSRYFTLHVELLGILEDEDLQIQPILLSSIETPPLIIRGRSPSNYHKDRTSGYRGHMQN